MKTINCHRKYPITTNFLDTMLEHSIDIKEGESKLDAYRRGLKELDQIAAELRKEAESMRGEIINPPLKMEFQGTGGGWQTPANSQSIPIISKDKEPEDRRIGILAADIESCMEVKTLEGYRLLAKTKPELQAAYDKRMNELLSERPKNFTDGLE